MGHEHEGETFFPIISAVKGKYGTYIALTLERLCPRFYPEMPRIGFARMPSSHRTVNLRGGGRIVVEGDA